MRTRFSRRALTLLVAAAVAGTAAPAFAGGPSGYGLASTESLGDGLEHQVWTRKDPSQVLNVAHIAPGAPFAMRAVLSGDAVEENGPRLERTSAMCARTSCAAAVNADFATDDGEPLGGVVSLGELARTPSGVHHQLVVGTDGRLSAGGLAWTGALVSTDLRRLDINGVNVDRWADALVLYTPAFGPATPAGGDAVEMTVEVLEPSGPVRLGQTALVRLASSERRSATAIPANGAVLSGQGRSAESLSSLWSRAQSGEASDRALLRLESTALESVGGSPILLREGKRWFADADTTFVRRRHPRTAVGWNQAGDVFLVTADGRQGSYAEGLTLAELADVMSGLGATEAINLDGGGSTTFVAKGKVVNQPSDRLVRRRGGTAIVHEPGRRETVLGWVERPVAVALTIVPKTQAPVPSNRPVQATSLKLPQALALPVPVAADPASNPAAKAGAFPAVVRKAERAPAKAGAVQVALLVLAAAVAAAADPRRLAPGFRR